MDQRSTVQSVISHINMAKREIENFPRSGLSKNLSLNWTRLTNLLMSL